MTATNKPNRYWGKAIASFLLVLFAMPLGHALMIIMEKAMNPTALHYSAFLMGFVGLVMTIVGVFVKGDTKQTLWGLFGGLLFWTGWVEFLFKYFADRFGVQPLIENGVVVTKPEYLILPASFGFYMMFVLLYLFSIRSGCNFFNWLQRQLFRGRRDEIVARPLTRHTAIVTFEELNAILWTSYLLLMFLYDKEFVGDHHPLTIAVGALCLAGSVLIFRKQLRLAGWGANIRMAIPTVIVFWTPVEILGRLNFFTEIWIQPYQHIPEMTAILLAFLALFGFLAWKAYRK